MERRRVERAAAKKDKEGSSSSSIKKMRVGHIPGAGKGSRAYISHGRGRSELTSSTRSFQRRCCGGTDASKRASKGRGGVRECACTRTYTDNCEELSERAASTLPGLIQAKTRSSWPSPPSFLLRRLLLPHHYHNGACAA